MLLKESNIPDWLKDNLDTKCSYCGSDFHIGFSPNGKRVTKHYCPNKECPATIAMKMAYMWGLLKVDGIKFARSLDVVKSNKLTHHLQAVPIIITNQKPKIHISVFMKICCIPGIEERWNSLTEKVKSVEEVLNIQEVSKIITKDEKCKILEYSKYFDIVFNEIIEGETVLRLSVMMTGDIMGLSKRENFIAFLNNKYKPYVKISYSPNKRKTGIDYLIKEENSPVTGKVLAAKESGIPIITPKDFMQLVFNRLRERIDEDELERIYRN